MSARFPLFFWLGALWLVPLSSAGAQDAPPVSNATPRDAASLSGVLTRLEEAARRGDANALTYFDATPPADASPLEVSTRITHVAVAPGGALVREVFGVNIRRSPPVVLSTGAQELWLPRQSDGSFAFPSKRFPAPPDALTQLQSKVEHEKPDENGEIFDVVASRVGGRWLALRSQEWSGTLSLPPAGAGQSVRDFLARQMDKAPRSRAVTAHFLFANGGDGAGWTGLGAAWHPAKRTGDQLDDLAASWRARIAGRDYLGAASHREFALALMKVGLWNEGADELTKAALLDPTTVSASELTQAGYARARDPQESTLRQQQDEHQVGLGADHPTYLINALQGKQQNQPNALGALRIALEYSRLAQDGRALAWTKTATDLKEHGAFSPSDQAWMKLLFDHLRERARLTKQKPTSILRSILFTVRCWPDDPDAITLLASLEEAQHTVYADFGIPMGNTEVLLWHNQSEFARYTTQFTAQGGNEFVAALTLTKLVTTRNGPLVLGEEVNTFSDVTDTGPLFGTLAHEYGHVAVRQLSNGRLVPVWFNEGIATRCEGGYEGYISRIKRAANAGTLLSMDELRDWDVDGERAFLAYSQANSIVDFIVETPGWGKDAVLEILRQIGRDVSPDQAFQNVLGLSQTQLWNRWAREGIK
jgi:hypothetical protein